MASVMGICGGLVGPKSGNVENVLVFNAFFEGVKGATSILRERKTRRDVVEKVRFLM